ncbi:MAG: UvrB/UvrC motif-containing protein [Gemmataceae bacterium]|nr:UvrB/UvrC motif-containing protein [Gemmataceae bacterium]MDW8265841.1 UvrB/UvrC motif-containing protein [Gemmataceae bacterium]
MSQDIDAALQGWEYSPEVVQARLVQASDGRQVIQLRVDLGLLQMETTGRPDGTRPHGCPTYLDYLKRQAAIAERAGESFVLDAQQCQEADREFLQFYHRRIAWLALRNYGRALADADHTLAFMNFVRQHSPSEAYTEAHDKYRGFVLFHRTQAAASLAVEQGRVEDAIDIIHAGLDKLRDFFAEQGKEDQMEQDAMVRRLRAMQRSLREKYDIEATLQEQLAEAVAREDYETAARLRDALRRRNKP